MGGFSDVRNQSIAAGFDYLVSQQWLTDFRFGFLRYRVFVNPFDFGNQTGGGGWHPGSQSGNEHSPQVCRTLTFRERGRSELGRVLM